MANNRTILAVVADERGEVFEHPDLLLAGMSGTETVQPLADEMIPMPEGSRLFTIPQTPPIGFDRRSGKQLTAERLPKQWGGGTIQAVSAFLTPGFTRTLLPAADYQRKAMTLPHIHQLEWSMSRNVIQRILAPQVGQATNKRPTPL